MDGYGYHPLEGWDQPPRKAHDEPHYNDLEKITNELEEALRAAKSELEPRQYRKMVIKLQHYLKNH